MKHANWREYAKDVSPRLLKHLDTLRLPAVDAYLWRSYWIYSYVHESLEASISANRDVALMLMPLIVEAQDLHRGICHAQEALLLAATTLQSRTALELRSVIAFIVESSDPAKYADRFVRYGDVEKYMYQDASPNAPKMTDAEKAEVRRRCPEWFRPDGSLLPRMNWTADAATNSIKRVAEAVGMLEDYQRVYGIASKLTHGSALVRNLYSNSPRGGMSSLCNPVLCSSQAVLGANYCLRALSDFSLFAGVPLPEEDILRHLEEGRQFE